MCDSKNHTRETQTGSLRAHSGDGVSNTSVAPTLSFLIFLPVDSHASVCQTEMQDTLRSVHDREALLHERELEDISICGQEER